MQTIVNGAPMTIFRGAQDLSTVAQVVEPEARPTHLAKVYLYTRSGPLTPQLVVGASRENIFHADSFDVRKKWANHATILANILNSQGNITQIQRLKPKDAGPNATIRLSLDLLAKQIPLYRRGTDGQYLLDDDGQRIPTGTTIAGYSAKWVLDKVTTANDGTDDFGTGAQKPGDQTDASTQTQSVRYPIMDLRNSFFGSDGNNKGVRLWTAHVDSSNPLDSRLLTQAMVYPFRIACISRDDDLSTPEVVQTTTTEQFVDVTFKPETLDRNTDTMIYIGDRFLSSYQDFDTVGQPPVYGPFGELHVYDANVKSILDLVYAAEFAAGGAADFDGADGEEYRFNLINGWDSQGRPYDSYLLDTSSGNALRLTEAANIYASGGSDGTMNDTLFAELVSEAVSDYANANSNLMDTVMNPESAIYDSGFPLQTKYDLMKFMAVRKDTACFIGTHDVLGKELSVSEEYSLAIALRTRMQNYPESEYFGTSNCRGAIIGRSGKLLQSQYTKRLPLTLDLAHKQAIYMGAANGKWKPGFAYDVPPYNQVTLFKDINITFTPSSVRNKEWATGLVTVLNFQRGTAFFPAFKTVYDKDDSVLNSIITMMGLVELEKIGEHVWREFSGRSDLTNSQLKERVENRVLELVQGKFDERFTIVPEVYFTEADIARGYSWSLRINLYAANMKTVQVLEIAARRKTDTETTA